MAEHSEPSAQPGRKNTGRTGPKEKEKFSPEEALEILEKALQITNEAGVPVLITAVYDEGQEYAGLILKNTQVWEGRLKYTGNKAESTGTQPENTGRSSA